MDLKVENEVITLRRLLETACDLLSEFGKFDDFQQELNAPVVQFLESDELREALV